MAYQAKRHKRFQEDFELLDSEGNVAHTLHVDLDADDMVSKISRKYSALTRALSDVGDVKRNISNKEQMESALETLGRAEVDLFAAVFGEENAGVIVDFYENRYVEMAQEVIPFITSVVIPRIAEIKKENKKTILSSYNRSQRRRLFR